ncbi:tRNA (N6-threonylcarbamoyladenosine(37)-N6)-methyltransferase TrmO [Oscillibacter sp.]|uniref:tRNA (N6-threonylcarbamoyladenosine(37)-N6)-methyltransferase TrmO n=1 Tax=Oscillibacter sp. TaxID=1945593 RepID=UPI0028A9DD20|nr:tRNA (N6-threonylcarbamoyladenosine(37)-N6)-methyltransferase TrmO [Oscillibacter sp.]
MEDGFSVKFIARIHSDFQTKFGVPRQSGLVEELESRVVFLPEYRNPDALRGLEGFSHLWLIWQFSESMRQSWSPTVRPPRLGGNARMGVFATRSPFRPNPIGLSCVKLLGIEEHQADGCVLRVGGADLMDGTPILDVKPYVPYVDAHPEATGGFAPAAPERKLTVECPPGALELLPEESRAALLGVLAEDPRPAYQDDPGRVYGFGFAGAEVKFSVNGNRLTVLSIIKN